MRRLRVLWVTPDLPRLGVAAARERWWNLLARLARRHEITLLAFVDPEDAGRDAELPPGLVAVQRVTKAPWTPHDPCALLPRAVRGGYAHPGLRATVADCLARGAFDVVQFEFVEMGHLMPAVPRLPTLLTVHQVGFAQVAPTWHAEGRPAAAAPAALFRYLQHLDFELRAVDRADRVITMSPEDASRLLRFRPSLTVSVSPVGVDTRRFRPPATPSPATDLLFVGHFGHPPNVDAVRFLVREVLPRLGRPARLRVVGHGAPPAVVALARQGSVEIVGPVADVRPELAAAAVSVAPVRFGTGMRGKVLEALAMGRPVVTTSLGAEGLGASAGRHLLIADGGTDFAAAVRRVLDDPALGSRLGAEGRSLVESRFDWDVIARAHEAIYDDLLAAPRRAVRAPGDEAPSLVRQLARLGPGPALAVGAALLGARGLRHHLAARGRSRPIRLERVATA